MPELSMTREDICTVYRDAKDKNRQIGILAELNATDKGTILGILSEAGFITGTPQQKEREKAERERVTADLRREQLTGLADKGFTPREAAEALGLSAATVKTYANRWGIRFEDGRHKKSAPAGGTAKAAALSKKESISRISKNSTSRGKKQASGPVAGPGSSPDMVALLLRMLEAVPLLWGGEAQAVSCGAGDGEAVVIVRAGDRLWRLAAEAPEDGG